jgi:putative transposase
LAVVKMSASTLRYRPTPDGNAALRGRVVALAHRHRRYGAGMIYLKLRQVSAVIRESPKRSLKTPHPCPEGGCDDDDATTEVVAVVPARALGGLPVTRVLDRLAVKRGVPRVLRTDNALEFCGRAMQTWAHERGVALRLMNRASPRRTPTSNPSTAACATGV